MKNPLLDVIRQSSGTDHALSDSGSFDTRAGELGSTANDEAIEAVNDAELELLEQTGAIRLDDGTITFELQDQLDDEAESETPPVPPVAVASISEFDPERAPLLSRFAPVICVAAALLAAAGWGAWTTVRAYSSESSIGANELPVPGIDDGSVAGTVHIAGAERFPFIDPEARSEAGDGE